MALKEKSNLRRSLTLILCAWLNYTIPYTNLGIKYGRLSTTSMRETLAQISLESETRPGELSRVTCKLMKGMRE